MESIHEMLDTVVQPLGYTTIYASNGEDAISLFKEQCPDIVLTDLRMSPMDGLELMKRLKEIDPNAIVIMMSGHADIENALASLKLGAFDYLTKPFKVDQLMAAIERAKEVIRESIESEAHDSNLALLGDAAATQTLKQAVARAANSPSPALIKGATGIQKSLIASAIHNTLDTEENERPFVTFDCDAESEDAFSKQIMGPDNAGGETIQKAEGGTLFIANIDTLPQALQPSFGELVRDAKSKVKLIFSTREDLETRVSDGTFDDSLFYRVSSQTIEAPSLKNRLEDVPLFAKSVLQSLNREDVSLSDSARSLLQSYEWPGNFVEFKEVIDEASSNCSNQTISEDDLPERIRDVSSWTSLAEHLEKASEEYKARVLNACQGDAKKAAEILGCEEETLAQA